MTMPSPKFFCSSSEEWEELSEAANESKLRGKLLSALQMQHVVVLAGSGTSLGAVGGPSMWDLWKRCVGEDGARVEEAELVISTTGYDIASEGENIEGLLSRCEAYLLVHEEECVRVFVKSAKKTILEMCTEFIVSPSEGQLEAHRMFLHRLSRRRARDSRLKLFTTNYDLAFEKTASRLGMVGIDGFSFTQPRCFNPRFFAYDIVRRPLNGGGGGTPLEGVFHLCKLHGSVNWARTKDGAIEVKAQPDPDEACIIYPATGKYRQSYVQPHLELVSQYLAALREPNTCIIVVGFGFNDDHLAEPIISAVQSNPHLRLVVVDPYASKKAEENSTENRHWNQLRAEAVREDVLLVNATFGEFAELIPELQALTPAQQIARGLKELESP